MPCIPFASVPFTIKDGDCACGSTTVASSDASAGGSGAAIPVVGIVDPLIPSKALERENG